MTPKLVSIEVTPERIDWLEDRIKVQGLEGIARLVVTLDLAQEMSNDGLDLADTDYPEPPQNWDARSM